MELLNRSRTCDLRRWAACLPIICSLVLLLYAATLSGAEPIPLPETARLLPPNTLLLVTVPDAGKFDAAMRRSPEYQLWTDPAMKPFVDKFVSGAREEFIQPLERELKVDLANIAKLARGQITLALLRDGEDSKTRRDFGFIFLLDAREESPLLQSTLSELRSKWAEAGRQVRNEKLRDYNFAVVPVTTNDIPATLRAYLPHPMEYHELGEEPSNLKSAPKLELAFGQVNSMLLVASSVRLAESTVVRLVDGSLPTLEDQAGFGVYQQPRFKTAPVFAWANTRVFLDGLARAAAQKKENPLAPNPVDTFRIDKLLRASGLPGLNTMAAAVRVGDTGLEAEVFLGASESSRVGLLKIVAGEPKETLPPPFIPADVIKVQRWRIDGQKSWAVFEKMVREVSAESANALNFILDTANLSARQKDPGFDIRRSLIGNLGDDVIRYQVARANGGNASEADSLLLVSSPRPEEMAASLQNILVFITAQAGAPAQREFLGRKIFSVPIPSLPFGFRTTESRTLHYAAGAGYVALSTYAPLLEAYLRSGEGNIKSLRETPGFAAAAQKVTGQGSSFFGYANQVQTMRGTFENLRKKGGSTNAVPLFSLTRIPGMVSPEKSWREWMDYSLLPPFDRISKYFGFSVSGLAVNVDGLTYKLFLPAAAGTTNQGSAQNQ